MLSELLSQVDNGIYVQPKKTTLANYLEMWLNEYAKNNLSPRDFILGLLVSVTFGLLLIPLSVVLWWPFLGFLLGSSWLWGKVGLSRPVLLLPGVAVAEVASAVVGLMPSMGEWQSRGMKLALCESWPHSLSLWKGHLSGLL